MYGNISISSIMFKTYFKLITSIKDADDNIWKKTMEFYLTNYLLTKNKLACSGALTHKRW